MVLRSIIPDIVIPDTSLSEYVLSCLARWRNKVTMIDSDNDDKKYNAAAVRENAMKCGSALFTMGLEKGDVVATCLTNSAEYSFIVIGVNACGGVITTSNPNYTKSELLYQLNQTKPKFVFVNSHNYKKLEDVCSELPSVKELFCIEDVLGRKTFSEFMKRGNSQDFPLNVKTSSGDTAIILYSSGTTGLPKGVMLTNKNMVSMFAIRSTATVFSRFDVLYLVMPMFHIFGVYISMTCLAQGTRMVVKKRFDFKQMLKDIEKYKITRISVAPPIVVAMDQLPPAHGYDLSSLKVIGCGAAPLPESVALSVGKKFNASVRQGWGLTEACPSSLRLDAYTPIASIGMVPPNTLLKILDIESGKELGCNQNGEICVFGPQVMKGYLNNPEATAKTIDSDGWLHTGDIGHYDEHEFIYIVDRLKELIKYKGFQVAPAELEDVLLRHPKIVDVGVIGIPNLETGEVPKAFVVRKDASLSEQEIHDFLKDKVIKYKYLRGGIRFVDSIPKSPSGKILRRLLREMEKNSINAKY